MYYRSEISMADPLTEEQEKFLAECETQFSARFTEGDRDFMQVSHIDELGLVIPL